MFLRFSVSSRSPILFCHLKFKIRRKKGFCIWRYFRGICVVGVSLMNEIEWNRTVEIKSYYFVFLELLKAFAANQ